MSRHLRPRATTPKATLRKAREVWTAKRPGNGAAALARSITNAWSIPRLMPVRCSKRVAPAMPITRQATADASHVVRASVLLGLRPTANPRPMRQMAALTLVRTPSVSQLVSVGNARIHPIRMRTPTTITAAEMITIGRSGDWPPPVTAERRRPSGDLATLEPVPTGMCPASATSSLGPRSGPPGSWLDRLVRRRCRNGMRRYPLRSVELGLQLGHRRWLRLLPGQARLQGRRG